MTEKAATPQPTGLTVHNQSRVLDVAFDDGSEFALPFEYLRVYSPSAEVQGHGKGQETLQLGNAWSASRAWSRSATTPCSPPSSMP